MLSDKERKDFKEKLKNLKNSQDNLRKSIKKDSGNEEDKDKYRPIAIVYEFISMILVVSFLGYFISKVTNTMPWTMIAFILVGFVYSFYRLYKSVNNNP